MKSFLLLLGVFVTPSFSICLLDRGCQNAKANYFDGDRNACAVLFDDDCCEGWHLIIPGNITRPSYTVLDNTLTADGINIFADNAKKDDAEALVVRAGCTLVVRTEPFGQRGYSRAFVAEQNKPLIVEDLDTDEYEDLNEKIEAVSCFCGGIKTKEITEAQSAGRIVTGALGGKNFRKCNDYVSLFDRPDDKGGKKTCAILFDEENCKEELEEVPSGSGIVLDEKDDAESIMVRPGCKFTGYDKDDRTGNKIVIDNTKDHRGKPKVQNLDGKGNLEERISSVDCLCA